MISAYKIEPSYVTIRKHRGAPAPGAPMVPTPMVRPITACTGIALVVGALAPFLDGCGGGGGGGGHMPPVPYAYDIVFVFNTMYLHG